MNLVLEYFRLCCIKTKIGIPKGGTEYQEAEDIIETAIANYKNKFEK